MAQRKAPYLHFLDLILAILILKYFTTFTQFYAIKDLTGDNSWAYESPDDFQTTSTEPAVTTKRSTSTKQSASYTAPPTAIKLASENEQENSQSFLKAASISGPDLEQKLNLVLTCLALAVSATGVWVAWMTLSWMKAQQQEMRRQAAIQGNMVLDLHVFVV
ncbi:hypothetical protein IFR05_008520 [Cadophora sp. M221]|nr:hypothetical protein IFR05_008520 [Cadophora sp. M221]